MAGLTAHITTFNCARSFPSSSHLAADLFSSTTSTVPPDLIVLCLQEIAPIGYAFLGGSFLAPYFASFTTIVHKAVAQHFESNADYIPLLSRHAGLTGLMVFARSDVKNKIRWIETAGVGVGVFEMGNKGAVGARLGIEGDDESETVPVTFVSAHLAPMEEEFERRNTDWKNICETLVFTRDGSTSSQTSEASQPLLGSETDGANDSTSGEHTLFSPVSHIFLAGDLNYRTSDLSPHPSDHTLWPHPTSSPDHPSWRDLWANDQLNREKRNGKTLHNLSEAPVNFPPTYKYSSAARDAAKQNKPLPSTTTDSNDGEKSTYPWAKHRVPSWCDRVLFLSSSKPEVESYDALPVQPTSDHRPVTLSVKIPLRIPTGADDVKAPFSMRRDWKERREAARRYEILVGIASYLALTWEGEAILAGTVFGLLGGYVALRAILAG
ncbi:hypothetical protein Q7P37_009485 [Cladosporium fusiforme]